MARRGLARLRDDVRAAAMLLTRLPVDWALPDREEGALPNMDGSVWAYPLIGAVVGAIAAVAYALAWWLLGLPLVAALLALVATVMATGCFHEDGLADVADGLGGGHTKEKKLEIMRDSRIGTYGTVAVVLALGLRAAALAALAEPLLVAAALIAGGALGRGTIVAMLATLRPARRDGLGVVAGRPSGPVIAAGLILPAAIASVCLPGPVALAAMLAALAAAWVIGRIAVRAIDGYTGDVLGTGAQVGEIAVVLTVAGLLAPAAG
ncbi:cobalamin-5'-phosphate synthase [Rhodothalassium salexigens DSM 2132]|uniref:Adenosylcobinamide-GDP ribazoletransferase n=1 Tax=Rhodothalassium salexigens DSM 2132 TaxID=1188247 RepID=A0A4R2PMN1_RHOSA|nr:adenosylcobinamide-GDP ribazoletransferase [Rhodothalassium salexigens]MBB4211384.1 adenosylcobinamide-GDP ribazoletransferase [Rhodothalassium salexigens DSM 2132]MBK1637717.1 adenosylcobinamide-GDP ribazoletransferase [Rhodothalassium salexigens DSM 2132]TCP35305.1 cobalamin-5'-phosphate synthase [Rhodothalassium salexigens DSM 2132]